MAISLCDENEEEKSVCELDSSMEEPAALPTFESVKRLNIVSIRHFVLWERWSSLNGRIEPSLLSYETSRRQRNTASECNGHLLQHVSRRLIIAKIFSFHIVHGS